MYNLTDLQNKAKEKGGELLSTAYNGIREFYKWKCGNPKHPPFLRVGENVLHDKSWCSQCKYDRLKTNGVLGKGLSVARAKREQKKFEINQMFISKELDEQFQVLNPPLFKINSEKQIAIKSLAKKYLQELLEIYRVQGTLRVYKRGYYLLIERMAICLFIAFRQNNILLLSTDLIRILKFPHKKVSIINQKIEKIVQDLKIDSKTFLYTQKNQEFMSIIIPFLRQFNINQETETEIKKMMEYIKNKLVGRRIKNIISAFLYVYCNDYIQIAITQKTITDFFGISTVTIRVLIPLVKNALFEYTQLKK